MFELIFTVVVLFPNNVATVNETILSKHTSMEDCLSMKQLVHNRLATDAPTTPNYLSCRKTRYDKL